MFGSYGLIVGVGQLLIQVWYGSFSELFALLLFFLFLIDLENEKLNMLYPTAKSGNPMRNLSLTWTFFFGLN
jgi:hypothetical protein